MITDPWSVPASSRPTVVPVSPSASSAAVVVTEFEDNFLPVRPDNSNAANALPDSAEYLASLEHKLQKLRTDSGYVQQLSARRQQCVERLLRGDIDLPGSAEFGYDLHADEHDRSDGGDGILGDLVRRHIRPEQAVSAAELLTLLHYDQLETPAEAAEAIATPVEEQQPEKEPQHQEDNVSR